MACSLKKLTKVSSSFRLTTGTEFYRKPLIKTFETVYTLLQTKRQVQKMGNNGEITFFDIWAVLKKRWNWIILWTLLVTAVGTALIQFVYNKQKVEYTLGFELSKDLINGKYPDGSPFRYDDLLSKTILTEIKESYDDFENIDADKIIQNNDIFFSYNVPENSENTYSPSGENVTAEEWYRTITVKGKYFKNRKQAKNFLQAIIEYPVKKSLLLVKVADFEALLEAFDACRTTYGEKIEYLHAQRDYLLSLYEEQISLYGANYIIEEGKTLTKLRLSTQNILTDEDISYLKNAVTAHYFVLEAVKNYYSFAEKGTNSIQILQTKKKNKEKELNKLQEKFQEIISYKGEEGEREGETFETQIATLTAEIVQIDSETEQIFFRLARSLWENRESMTSKQWESEWKKYNDLRLLYGWENMTEEEAESIFYKSQKEFDALLSDYRVDLGVATDTYREIKTILSGMATTVRYKSFYPLQTGTVGWAVTLFGFLLGSAFLTSFLFCYHDFSKMNGKRKKTTEKSQNHTNIRATLRILPPKT